MAIPFYFMPSCLKKYLRLALKMEKVYRREQSRVGQIFYGL